MVLAGTWAGESCVYGAGVQVCRGKQSEARLEKVELDVMA